MEILILIMHVLTALTIVGLVLLQQGKGADIGAAFGSGSAGSMFGSAGSANFLSRTTAVLAVVFFLTSLGLTYMSSRTSEPTGVMATQPAPAESLPDQIPTPGVPAAKPAPAEGGSKAGEVPK
jgi:preprotein translocase subunit SecG